jgi:hypothetical protein
VNLPFRVNQPAPSLPAGISPGSGPASLEAVLAWFDSLPPVALEQLQGLWKGREIATGHPMDGWLEASGWLGKEFEDPETVHPLVFRAADGSLLRVRPHPWAMRSLRNLSFLKAPAWWGTLRRTTALLRNPRSQARLRMVEYRGVVSAAMLYDELPIIDCFRRISDDQVLGLMDEKGTPEPYAFLLERVDRTGIGVPRPSQKPAADPD